ncbi:DUF4412 domain-containing protein [Thiorhodococcus mannitoliphagus]|uniref:DUF4412 domain-containing protein n=1 Tax=Thiorhodococcus mannitoliphagus TaxID=329406 RepID=A0A6P1DT89_9GAMM|nr:DUF4412 domain-containing protein [Thiorhodococcus mannitoliphagus]NEX18925.1 DUF4412 domain-containing protein [Thiorhodococcus mannitoliphagus]
MKNRRLLSKYGIHLGVAILLAAAFNLSAAVADDQGLYIETVNRSKGLTGEAPREEISKTYVAYGKMKVASSDPQGTDMIIVPETGVLTFINDEAKQFYTIDTKGMMAGMSQPGIDQMRAMMEQTKVSVERTDETKQINDWNCRKYLVRKTGMMDIEQEVWATEDVDIDLEPFTNLMSMSGPDGLLGDSPAAKAQREEMDKIAGYPILTISKMQMMGANMETESEVKVIRQEPMPAAMFEVPEGYSEREMGPPGGQSAEQQSPH